MMMIIIMTIFIIVTVMMRLQSEHFFSQKRLREMFFSFFAIGVFESSFKKKTSKMDRTMGENENY